MQDDTEDCTTEDVKPFFLIWKPDHFGEMQDDEYDPTGDENSDSGDRDRFKIFYNHFQRRDIESPHHHDEDDDKVDFQGIFLQLKSTACKVLFFKIRIKISLPYFIHPMLVPRFQLK